MVKLVKSVTIMAFVLAFEGAPALQIWKKRNPVCSGDVEGGKDAVHVAEKEHVSVSLGVEAHTSIEQKLGVHSNSTYTVELAAVDPEKSEPDGSAPWFNPLPYDPKWQRVADLNEEARRLKNSADYYNDQHAALNPRPGHAQQWLNQATPEQARQYHQSGDLAKNFHDEADAKKQEVQQAWGAISEHDKFTKDPYYLGRWDLYSFCWFYFRFSCDGYPGYRYWIYWFFMYCCCMPLWCIHYVSTVCAIVGAMAVLIPPAYHYISQATCDKILSDVKFICH